MGIGNPARCLERALAAARRCGLVSDALATTRSAGADRRVDRLHQPGRRGVGEWRRGVARRQPGRAPVTRLEHAALLPVGAALAAARRERAAGAGQRAARLPALARAGDGGTGGSPARSLSWPGAGATRLQARQPRNAGGPRQLLRRAVADAAAGSGLRLVRARIGALDRVFLEPAGAQSLALPRHAHLPGRDRPCCCCGGAR